MLDRYGMAVMEERHHDRRLAALEDYLRREYGSTNGMERYIAEANHAPSPRTSVRTFLAKVAGAVRRPRPQPVRPAVSVEQVLSSEQSKRVRPIAPVTPAPAVRPLAYRGRVKVRPRAGLPPLKR